ncbi:hypothetical protein H4219_001403 [Mycoemilia scoparia]|uniref:UTP23 sensor motif region domain-containing protein n=1 Tax=Mycoemilia scoparia TaxID=417184 RepID=A0A9W8A892_9FUNG|nr:hypothetical protein H4219_001403 [Mycoemilia scoparia]
MRAKRGKQYKKCMEMYKNYFGFREPYQVIMTADFIKATVDSSMNIQNQLYKTLTGTIKQNKDLEKNYLKATKYMEKRRCNHRNNGEEVWDSQKCIQDIIGEKNQFNYCVATQDSGTRFKLRQIAGVPILHISRSVLILEPPSDLTVAFAHNKEREKVIPQKEEIKLLNKIFLNKSKNGTGANSKPTNKPPKRKRAKEPNPLSVKKPKKEKPNNQGINEKVVSTDASPATVDEPELLPNGGEEDAERNNKRPRRKKRRGNNGDNPSGKNTTPAPTAQP